MIFRDLFIVLCIYLLWRFHGVWKRNYIPKDVKDVIKLIQPFSRFNREAFQDLIDGCTLFYSKIHTLSPQTKLYFEKQIDDIVYSIDRIDMETPGEPYTDMMFEQCKDRLRLILDTQMKHATKRHQ